MDFSRYSPHEKCYSENFCKVFFIVVCFSYLGIDLGMRLLGDTVTLYLTLWGTVKSVGKVTTLLGMRALPPMYKGSLT